MSKHRSTWFAALSAMGVTAGLMAAPALADDVEWQGVNMTALADWLEDNGEEEPFDLTPFQDPNVNLVSINGNDYHVWGETGNVPGAGDTAIFLYGSTSSVFGDVNVTAGAFDPDHLELHAGGFGGPTTPAASRFNVLRDLDLQTLTITSGYTSSGQGEGIFFVGEDATLTISGDDPLTFGGNRGSWASLELAEGATLRFDGDSQTFDSRLGDGANQLRGGGHDRVVAFSNANATITLSHLGTSTNAPNIHLGTQKVRFHADQTWLNPEGTGVVSLQMVAGEQAFESITGDRLDNMGQVALQIGHTGGNDTSLLPGGTFQSIEFTRSATSNRHNQIRMQDDIHLTGGHVIPGDGDEQEAVQSQFSLYHAFGNRYGGRLILDGNTLTTDRGVWLEKTGSETHVRARNLIVASNATLNIGGDLIFDDSLDDGRRTGVTGDAGTVVNLGGSFSANSRSLNEDNLHLATMNLTGGTSPMPNTFEVGADARQTIASGTFALGTLNVGTASSPAHVVLVNDHLNDNEHDIDFEQRGKEGEVLLAGELNIAADSVLDLAGHGAKIVNGLSIDSGGTLDLNTGLGLEADDIVAAFFGVGDQTATWNSFAGDVIDSSNSEFSFVAVTDNDNTYWQAVPEPASLALVGLGSLLMLRRRRAG